MENDLPDRVASAIREVCGVTMDEMVGRSRERRIAAPRQLFSAILHRNGLTCLTIGKIIGRIHAAVVNHCRRDECDAEWCADYRRLKENVYKLLNQQSTL